MPTRKTSFENGEIYHIILRSVGDTEVFKDERDYFRAIFSLYEFNNDKKVNIWLRRQQRKAEKKIEKEILLRGRTAQDSILPERDVFVEVLAFAIMPNHIHLLLKQIKDNGITLFMQKFGGLAWYFNKKYTRKGHLFCTFRSVHIKSDEQLRNVFVYIHCNPLSLIEPGWKEKGIKDPAKAIVFLKKDYRWSSFFDYLGENNFSSVTQREFLLDLMHGKENCFKAIEDKIYLRKVYNFTEIGIE